MSEPVIHNPVNIEMNDLRYRFCYKGETRRIATHMWNPANAAWQEMGSSFDGPLNPDFTYRTYKYLPYTPLFETVQPAGPPPEAVAHGAPVNVIYGNVVTGSTFSVSPSPDKVDTVLDVRGESYGRFVDNAQVAQSLKAVIAGALIDRTEPVPADAAEGLDMILSKISRLVSGDINHIDGWRDIEGYARLIRERIEGNPR